MNPRGIQRSYQRGTLALIEVADWYYERLPAETVAASDDC
jgi:hypothetical protein